MDPLSTTASVIAVVTAALRCAKTIREIICGIRDGPTYVQELGMKMSDIRDLLNQLKAVGQRITGNEFDELKATMQRCANDLAMFEEKILKLREVPGEKKWAIVNKRIKATLKEDDFLSMGRRVTQYIETIGVQLEIIGTEMRLDHSNAISVVREEVAKVNNQLLDHSLTTNRDMSILSETTDALHTIRDNLDDDRKRSVTNWDQTHLDHRKTISALHLQSDYMMSTDQRIKDISDDASSRWEESLSFQQGMITTLERQTGKLDAMEASSRTQSDRNAAHHQATLQGVMNVNDKLANLSNITSEQLSVIMRMLQQIESAQATTGGKAINETTDNEDGDRKKKLSETLDRLCLLAEENGTVHSDEAQTIIEDLEHVLDVISNFASLSREAERKRKRLGNDGNSGIALRDVKRMRGLLMSASAVALNPQAHPKLPLTSAARYRSQNRHTTLESGGCNFLVLARNIHCRQSDPDSVEGVEGVEELFAGSVTCMPNSSEFCGDSGSTHRLQIRATFLQKIRNNGSFALVPTLAFSAVLPADSDAFVCATKGDLQGLLRLLNEGRASLGDCDSDGRQLLHYACRGLQLTMCKFLLQNGADPDCLAKDVNGDFAPPIFHGYDAMDLVQLQESETLEFQGLLLDAGADPTLSVGGTDSPFEVELRCNDDGCVESLQMFLDRGSPFLHLDDSPGECGNTPLMRLAWKLDLGQLTAYAGKIALLLKRGASSQASNQHGNTVLHITIECFARSGAAIYEKDELHDSLTSVIGAGADVTARNKAGYTVSGYAYLWGLGAQWENALRESGNDPSKVCGTYYRTRSKIKLKEREDCVIVRRQRYQLCEECGQSDMSMFYPTDQVVPLAKGVILATK